MGKRASLYVVVGMAGGMWLSGGLFSPPSASAQVTQTEIKAKARQGAVRAQEQWKSMTPAAQQKAKARGQTGVQNGRATWQAATPQAQQAAKSKGAAAVQQGRKKWQGLPQ